ncbi:MAG: putative hydrolases or acyltransferases (alpha/beta hydrolase superfamily) [Rhodobacteraceae bacterium HLUCCA12]|nr:MAG: putative hydrolases or acyltransferases (alpha/beta hydrolase superfamily) [Rhodobacteraceae bacterium HLUCCA12]
MPAGLIPSPLTVILGLTAALVLLAGCAAVIDAQATRREARWEAANPPAGRFVTVEGHQIHLREMGQPAGSAPDLVLIHGANGNLRDFTFDLTDRLKDDYRIIALDRPGLGWSDSWGTADGDPRVQARILRRAVAGLGVRQPIVLGHSYGGAVAMAWALEAPQDTAALVIVSGATYPWEGALGLWYRINAGPLGSAARHLLSALVPETAARITFRSVFDPHPLPDGYVDHFGAGLSMRRSSQANNTRQVNALNGFLRQMQPGYADLSLPIELVHGEQDTIVGLDIHSARLESEVASARLERLPDAGHMPHHSHPDTVVAAVARARDRAGLR